MCWNAEVSLQTFLFGFVSFFIAYFFHFPFQKLVFFLSFTSIQLLEYFLWTFLKNSKYNKLFSIIGYILITLIPFVSLYLITDIPLRNKLMILYVLYFSFYTIYKYPKLDFKTTIGENHHLLYNFIPQDGVFYYSIWMIFFFLGVILSKDIVIILFAFVTIIFSVYYQNKDRTFSSYWCYSANFLWIYVYIFILLKKMKN